MSENTETAILAGGCFWPMQQLLRHRDGVISTRVRAWRSPGTPIRAQVPAVDPRGSVLARGRD
jgi:hypothetical protein